MIYSWNPFLVRHHSLGECYPMCCSVDDSSVNVLIRRPNTACPYTNMTGFGFEVYRVDGRTVQSHGICYMVYDLSTGLTHLLRGREIRDARNVINRYSFDYGFGYSRWDEHEGWKVTLTGGTIMNDKFACAMKLFLDESGKLNQVVAALKDLNVWPEDYAEAKLERDFLGGIRIRLAGSKPGTLSDLISRIAGLSRK